MSQLTRVGDRREDLLVFHELSFISREIRRSDERRDLTLMNLIFIFYSCDGVI